MLWSFRKERSQNVFVVPVGTRPNRYWSFQMEWDQNCRSTLDTSNVRHGDWRVINELFTALQERFFA
ncbi:MAG: hypothetical protein Rhims3KO_32820 [Hyphomicrobiales bacterium]